MNKNQSTIIGLFPYFTFRQEKQDSLPQPYGIR